MTPEESENIFFFVFFWFFGFSQGFFLFFSWSDPRGVGKYCFFFLFFFGFFLFSRCFFDFGSAVNCVSMGPSPKCLKILYCYDYIRRRQKWNTKNTHFML